MASARPIDAFILAKLREQGLTPSPEADRRTLIRRLSLRPHRPAADARGGRRVRRRRRPADAYEKLVDRLLAIAALRRALGAALARRRPLRRDARLRQGQAAAQRLALPRLRHPRLQRGQALRAGSSQEQIAGDVLFPDDARRRSSALGFIAAGPWDFIGHVELREGTIDEQDRPHLDRDDMVANTMSHVRQPDRPLRPLPQPQVRPDPAGGLLPPAGRVRRRRPRRPAVRPRPGRRQRSGRS